MKKRLAAACAAASLICMLPLHAGEDGPYSGKTVPPAEIPAAKRPRAYEASSDGGEYAQKTRDTLAFGIDSEITELIDELQREDDRRFAGEIYDLFQSTRSAAVREKVIAYFTKLEDPCLENYAVEILNDPFDADNGTVGLLFDYVAKVRCAAAVPAVHNLIAGESEDYMVMAIRAMGDIGNDDEAVFLSGYMERDDLSVSQRQELIKVLGRLRAADTFDTLVGLAEDENENSFVRRYSAEAIGAMGNPDAVPVLMRLFEDSDPNLRVYVIKGLSHFDTQEARAVLLQGIRDNHYSVRLESISAAKEKGFSDAVPYLIYRARNDSQQVVKDACYPAIAKLNTSEGNEYLVSVITDEKLKNDSTKAKVAAALLEYNNAGVSEIVSLAESVLNDNTRKPLRYALGKEFAKHESPAFAEICVKYLDSKDVATQGTGLDIYAKNRFPSVTARVQELAAQEKESVNQKKAKRILER